MWRQNISGLPKNKARFFSMIAIHSVTVGMPYSSLAHLFKIAHPFLKTLSKDGHFNVSTYTHPIKLELFPSSCLWLNLGNSNVHPKSTDTFLRCQSFAENIERKFWHPKKVLALFRWTWLISTNSDHCDLLLAGSQWRAPLSKFSSNGQKFKRQKGHKNFLDPGATLEISPPPPDCILRIAEDTRYKRKP